MFILANTNFVTIVARLGELKWRFTLCQLTTINGYLTGITYAMKTLSIFVKTVSLRALLTTASLSIALVGLFYAPKAQPNELSIDVGYQDGTAIDTRYRIKSGLFLTSSAHKDVLKAGMGYGFLLDDFFILASYDSEKVGAIYGSYKPRKAHWQMGLRFEQGETSEHAEIEYTYLFQDSVGAVIKIDTDGRWFLGLRKWL